MFSGIIRYMGNLLIKYLIMPFLSSLLVWAMKKWQEYKDEKNRNAAIDAAVKKFENAKTPEEKEAAFRELVRSRSNG